MRDDFVNKRFIYKQSTPVSLPLQEISVLPNFDTFFHVFQPGQFGNKWYIVTNNGQFQYYDSRSLVVGLLNPWNDGTNQPQVGGGGGGPGPGGGSITGIRTPTRTCIGFDLSSLPDNAIIDEATLELTIDGSRSWSGGSVDNHPLTIRLMPSDISSNEHYGLDWNTSHTQGINCDIKPIPNILDKIKEVTDPTGSNTGIGGTRSNETSAAAGGGDYISTEGLTNGINRRLVSTSSGATNAINITPLVQQYLQCIRPNVSGNSYQFNLIIHGKNDMRTMVATTPASDPNGDGGTYAEYKFIQQGLVATNDWHLNDAYVSFKSVDNVCQSIVASNISFRKEMHYYYCKIILFEQCHGFACTNRPPPQTGITYSRVMLNPFNDEGELSNLGRFLTFVQPGMTIGFNDNIGFGNAGFPTTATAYYNQYIGDPNNVYCNNRRQEVVSSGLTLTTFRTGTPENPGALFSLNRWQLILKHKDTENYSIFNNSSSGGYASYQLYGRVHMRSDVAYPWPWTGAVSTGSITPWYRVQSTTAPMYLRIWHPTNYGSHNIIAMNRPSNSSLPTFASIGITGGSIIRVSGSSNPANNGVYIVLQAKEGVDFVEVDDVFSVSRDRFKYLYVNRPIVPEEQGSSITIENISPAGWPVLNIKYSVPT